MKNIIFLVLLAAALFLAFYFYRQQSLCENEISNAEEHIEGLERQVSQQRTMLDSVSALVMAPDTMELVPPGGAAFIDELGSLSEADIRKLQRKGLNNPEAELQTDLTRKQRTLIPTKGTLGGTMQIRDTRILTNKYALAYFEDGHKGGYMLLRYSVENGKISWELLDHYTI